MQCEASEQGEHVMSEIPLSRAVAEIRGTDASRCLQNAEFGGGAVVLRANII